ncbi:MAG: family 10 glycosylhydrolase [Candidatus Brocadiaceae bacterium]|nr:family 10 glycosylhydrolase [Candidatus Brocadiaceae bacterium]
MRPLLAACLLAIALMPACAAPPPAELRGAWVSADACMEPAAMDALLNRAQTLNLNSLYVQVFHKRGHALYRSGIVPPMAGIPAGFDPLAYVVTEGHRRGLQVHAWFVNGSYGWGPEPGILDERPSWRTMDLRGVRVDWYDLCRPEVREWQTNLMAEVLERYDVDGVHLDYVRFDNKAVCTCPACRENARADLGIDIGSLAYPELPACGALSANPLAAPTTAQVLATFDDGVPAVALNQVGRGSVLLLNWQVTSWCPRFVVAAVQNTLTAAGVAPRDRVFLLDSDLNATRYRRTYWRDRPWLEAFGYRVERTTDAGLAQLPPGTAVVLPGFYMMNEDIARTLLTHVRAGGCALFLDGPVFAMSHASARELLGFRSTAKYFRGERTVRPTGARPDLVPISARPFAIAAERAKLALWDSWRKEQITRLVESVCRRAKQVRPDAVVTAAVYHTESGADSVLQDWPRWHREGLCDYVIPMSYVRTPDALEAAFAWWKRIDPALTRILPGVGAWDIAPDTPRAARAREIERQIAACRRQGARGVVLFSLNALDDELAALLGPTAFPGPAAPPAPTGGSRRR